MNDKAAFAEDVACLGVHPYHPVIETVGRGDTHIPGKPYPAAVPGRQPDEVTTDVPARRRGCLVNETVTDVIFPDQSEPRG